MTELAAAVGCSLLISFVCSLFEAVLYSTPKSAVEMMVKSGSPAGRIFAEFKREVQKPITAILTLNTMANTAGASVAGAYAVEALGHGWLVPFSAAFTLSILLFSEILPKTLGVHYHKALAPWVAFPLRGMVILLSPFTWFVSRLLSVVTPAAGAQISPQEIVSLARLGRKEGTIAFFEEKVIENILSLKDKKAEDIMTPRPVVFSLEADLTVEAARRQAGHWPHSRVPVFKEGSEDIVGLVMRRDFYNAIADGNEGKKLSELMRPIHFVPAGARADKLLREFLEKRQHQFVVIDEYGGVAGVVTLEDVLEEVIGHEIVDEFDHAADMGELARKRRQAVMKSRPETP